MEVQIFYIDSIELKIFILGCICFFLTILFAITSKYTFKNYYTVKVFSNLYSLFESLWPVLIIASLIMFFCIQAFKIPTGSMKNTIIEGDHIFVSKSHYGIRFPFFQIGKRYFRNSIKRGDIIVFQAPSKAMTMFDNKLKKDFIKRCVAIEGDLVEIKNKKLYINKNKIEEPYIIFNKEDVSIQNTKQNIILENKKNNFGPLIIPKNHYMMLGDNRDFSYDSRFWGPLHDKYIKGKALIIYWPIYRWRILK
ncbi:MAG: signal peptidase I [Endomicrobium sp.]|nr:signal peptidase I [Endomicrobium sp.]